MAAPTTVEDLQAQVERLTRENAELRARVAKLEAQATSASVRLAQRYGATLAVAIREHPDPASPDCTRMWLDLALTHARLVSLGGCDPVRVPPALTAS